MARAPTTLARPDGAPRLPIAVRPATAIAGFVALYLLFDWLSYIHASQAFGVTPWNPQPALAIALLAFAGQRMMPAVFAAVLLSEILVRAAPAPGIHAAFSSLALTLGYAATAQWLTSRHGPRLPLASHGDLARLLASLAGGTLLTGSLFVGTLLASGQATAAAAPEALLQFWVGDAVGIVVTLPLILVLLDAARREQLRLAARGEALLQLAAIVAVLWIVLRGPPLEQVKYFYLLFLPVVWIAARHGLAGAALAIAIVQAGVVLEVHGGAYESMTVFELQAEVIALAATGLFLGMTVDERKRLSEELRRSLHLASAGRMAAALAHELNQPLTALTSFAAAARRIASAQDVARESLSATLDRLVSEAQRAAQVVRRMRDFFRTGSVDLRPTRCDEVATAVVESMRADAQAAGVEIALEASGVPVILADALQVEIVLRNLVANAVQALGAAPAPRRVTVSVGHDGGRFVHVTVADTGPGLSPEARLRLFEPFATTRATGMGMGLAIGRAIVEAHGGELTAGDGPGGSFRFTLPAREAADD
jgi:two-component system sensor kinase FixL